MSIIKNIKCPGCTAELEIRNYKKYVICPFCGTRIPFDGFEYEEIDYSKSILADIEFEADCPSCRGQHMVLRRDGNLWKCLDCGYKITPQEMMDGVFWFCDECETFLNIQPGFNDTEDKWICKECGHLNELTEDNIF